MLFSTIGSIYNTLKTVEMTANWQLRKKNPTMPKEGAEDPQMKHWKKEMEELRKSNMISSLDGKLKAGGELTDEELAYLKENSPELYQEAVEIKRERQQYKKELATCKTKDDVEKLNARKMQEFVNQVRVIRNNPSIPEGEKRKQLEKILKRVMGVQSEHIKFVKSKEYEELPRESEIAEEEKAKKKKKASAAEEPAEAIPAEPKTPDDPLEAIKEEFPELLLSETGEAPKESASGAGEDAKIYTSKGELKSASPQTDSPESRISVRV